MTTRIAAIVFWATLAAGQTGAPTDKSQPDPGQMPPPMMRLLGDYAGWWKALSDEAKDSFVDGYTTAMRNAEFTTHKECMDEAKSVQPGPEFNTKMQESLQLCALSEAFDYKAGKALRLSLDRFYRNPLNARIPADLAMEYVRDELKGGKTAAQLLDELNEWRKISE